jgi:hypothetical protein
MRSEMEKPDALASATDPVEGQSLPVGIAENGPDAPQANSMSFGSAASPPLADIAVRINEAHDQVSASARSTIEAAMEAGRLLIQAKDQVGHGGWLPWLKANTSVSERTAQAYMKLARDLPKSAVTADLTLDGALKLLVAPEADPKRRDAHRSAASPRSSKVEVLPPQPKPPGSSPNLLTDDALVDRIRCDIEAAGRRGIDIPNLVPGPSVSNAQVSAAPPRMSADPAAAVNHCSSSSSASDVINPFKGTQDAGTADDEDEDEKLYGPLTAREWYDLSHYVELSYPRRGPKKHKPGDPTHRPEFLKLVAFFNLPFARWMDRVMADNGLTSWFG